MWFDISSLRMSTLKGADCSLLTRNSRRVVSLAVVPNVCGHLTALATVVEVGVPLGERNVEALDVNKIRVSLSHYPEVMRKNDPCQKINAVVTPGC